jgi:asparagine synthase (glutamine-hydrolysing)
MCGICGYIHFKQIGNADTLKSMVETLSHRGPDGYGHYEYKYSNIEIGLGHTRLAIIDLSSAGHQPMHFNNLSITLNGEIYNYRELREELKSYGHIFISDSDTEVVLHSFSQWGTKCVDKFIGMFAFVILDKENEKLYAFRDRAGVKPFYYYESPDTFLFASELKALLKHPDFKQIISKAALVQYFNLGYISAPLSIYENCKKLKPGHFITIDLKNRNKFIDCYWDLGIYYQKPDSKLTYNEAKQELDSLLKSAFNYRMVADVPVGVFLSGGYDSTAVTAILQNQSEKRLKTYTIGFREGINEAPFASEIAKYLGTDHTELYCTMEDAKQIVPELPYYYDEPFSDSSAIPTILVSRLAKQDVTVALSADAGDEIFAGYTKYDTYISNLSLFKKIPKSLHFLLNKGISMSTSIFEGEKLEKLEVLRSMLDSSVNEAPFILLNGYDQMPYTLTNRLLEFDEDYDKKTVINNNLNIKDNLSLALLHDFKQYLPDDILAKVDRATMSVALEGREPFLDHRILEFAAQLPSNYKFRDGIKKAILKDLVHQYVPKTLLDRPKIGFGLPIHSWLRNELKYLIEEYLADDKIKEVGLFNVKTVKKIKYDFFNDKSTNHNFIWKLLQFQMWYFKWM